MQNMQNRRIIQLFAFFLISVSAVLTIAICASQTAAASQRDLEYTYQRSFYELIDYVSSMETALQKAGYANTPSQQAGLSSHLMQQASSAKSALSALPLQENTMETVQKFLTQVAGFSETCNQLAATGGTFSQEEQSVLEQLASYASRLKADLLSTAQQLQENEGSFSAQTNLFSNLQVTQEVPEFSSILSTATENFKDYPTLLYDGPFSDHIEQEEAKLIQQQATISVEKARSKVSEFLQEPLEDSTPVTENNGKIPTYNFTIGSKYLQVTQQGGLILTFRDSRPVAAAQLSREEAAERAAAFLSGLGLTKVTERYDTIHDNLCTIQYFATEDGILLYPDLIKVSVALDTGEIVEYNATGYLMNHQARSFPTPALSESEAKEKLSPQLTVTQWDLALIPTKSGKEALCYEFFCIGKQQEELLVYLNVETGMEEQILILLRSDDGTLTL